MKKYFVYALSGAIALTSMYAFTACSSSNDALTEQPEETNPNYNPATGEVLTKFVFNVATGNTTRQTSAATQASSSETFRGINSAVLLSFKQTDDNKHISAATNADKRYDLQSIMSAGSIDETNSHRVIETSLPLNTNSMIFYGKAIQSSPADYEAYGHLDDFTIANPAATGLDMSATNIELGSRINGNLENFQKIETLLAGILTCIMNSNLNGSHKTAVTFQGNTVDYPDGIYWASYANISGMSPVTPSHELYALEKKLADVYKEMTNIRDAEGELRGGCAHNIIYTIQAMWSVVNEVRYATPFCKEEAVAQALANHIHNRIGTYFNGTVPASGAEVTDVSFKTATDNIIDAFIADKAWPTAADERPEEEYFSSINSINLNQFPEELYHVPAGSAHYKFDSTKQQFYYQQDYNTSAVGGGGFNVTSYFYPAELCYFGNSPVRTSSAQVRPADYPNGVATWKNDASWSSSWNGTHVTSSTQAVAMKNNINYGTSLLKTTVQYGATNLQDNNHNIQYYKDNTISPTDEPNNVITVSATSFLLNGILIGGQSKKVGWNYLPKTVTAPETNPLGYIYDNVITSTSIPLSDKSAPNYTLVFDNFNATAAANSQPQDKVYVALELVNNTDQDFYGEHGLIRKGGTFYLIGELDPNKTTGITGPTWADSDHPLPPYNADGTTNKVPRVFIQDYMTSVNFKISEYSLQHAYLTVPDLRYSALTLGLSVDMTWSTGIDFGNIIIGGGEITTPTNP